MVKFKSQASSIQHESLLPQEETLEVGRHRKKLIIGVPKEDSDQECRVALTPLAVEVLVDSGHDVFIQSGAGDGIHFTDMDYSEKGATIVKNPNIVYQCDIVLKISPPTIEEIDMLKGDQVLLSSLHITCQSKEYIEKLIRKRITALSYEYFKDRTNSYPVVRAMSEIAGSSSILIASELLNNTSGGKGIMLGGITGVNPAEVVILGAGTAGEFAARTAIGLGALVKVFDNSISNLRRLQNNLGQRIFTSVIQPGTLGKALVTADVVIGALRILGETPRFIVPDYMVETMKKASVIVDICIDQGGCFETSRMTTHSEPTFVEKGVIHYCVPNIASRVARSASYALSDIFLPLLLDISDCGGMTNIIKQQPGLREGIYLYNGILTNKYIGDLFGIQSKDINLLMIAF